MKTKVYKLNQNNTLGTSIPKEIKFLLSLEADDQIEWSYDPKTNKVCIKKQ